MWFRALGVALCRRNWSLTVFCGRLLARLSTGSGESIQRPQAASEEAARRVAEGSPYGGMNGMGGGKQPAGKGASRSPFFSISAASRYARSKR